MISPNRATHIEEGLANLVNVRSDELRDYLNGNIEAGPGRRTGYKFVRGTHSGHFERDPKGTDILPVGYEAPRWD